MGKKFAIVVHAGANELARALHGLLYAKELYDAGHEVKVVFDGAGTTWVKAFADPQHKYHQVYRTVRDLGVIAGACDYCATAFGVSEDVREAGIALFGDAAGHPSLAGLVEEGFTPLVL